jgi:hypothetical protein
MELLDLGHPHFEALGTETVTYPRQFIQFKELQGYYGGFNFHPLRC